MFPSTRAAGLDAIKYEGHFTRNNMRRIHGIAVKYS